MMYTDLARAEVSFHLHATEDEKKVIDAICKVFKLDNIKLEKTRMQGHFGNIIVAYSMLLNEKDASKLWNTIIKSLHAADREELKRSFDKRLEDNLHLHIRLDKQAIVLGEVKLGESDPIKVRFTFSRKVKEPYLGMIQSFDQS